MRKPNAHPAAPPDETGSVSGARIGRVAGPPRGSTVPVEVDGCEGPIPARLAANLAPEALREAAAERREAVLLFEDGDLRRPILVALLASATPLTDALLTARVPAGPRDARLDGVRVELDAREEVVLRCGRASLTLRRNGDVVLRGVNVRTEATQVQKIRGGKVQIN